MFFSDIINRAVIFASRAHKNQKRKDPESHTPFIQHPVMVGIILQRAGFNDDVIASGILHDVLEDTEYTKDDLEKHFNKNIAEIVNNVSEQDKSLPWAERKQKYIEHIKTCPPEAKAVSAADKIHNIQSIIRSIKQGINIWPVFKRGKKIQIERFKKLLYVLRETWEHPIIDELEQSIKELESIAF
jgi:(p)ppGpp synthase/HD superfamily hydrolase